MKPRRIAIKKKKETERREIRRIEGKPLLGQI